MKIFEILLWLGGVQGILLAVILATYKSNQPANRYLGIGVFFLSIELFYLIIAKTNSINNYSLLIGLLYSLLFIYVPMLFFYVQEVTKQNNQGKYVRLLHFAPFIICLIFFTPIYFENPLERHNQLLLIHEGRTGIAAVVNNIKPFYGVGYILLIIYLIQKHNKKIKNSFSNLDKINFNWFKNLIVVLVVISVIVALQNIFEFIYDEKSILEYFLFTAIVVWIYLIGYFGLKQPEIFIQEYENKSEESGKDSKYSKSGLDEKAAGEILSKLINIMEEEKPYLDGNLTLHELASKTAISSHNLSEILNTKLNQNFYDFVNKYRVEEFKKKINEGLSENRTMLSLAYDSGFNSKSSFNTIFKKHTGATPTEYKSSSVK